MGGGILCCGECVLNREGETADVIERIEKKYIYK